MEVNSKSGSNLTKVIWRIETLNAVGDSNGGVTKVTWRIQNFSGDKDQKLCSENFTVDGNKWNIVIYPKGDDNNLDHLSIYLDVADSATLPSGWTRFVRFGFAVIDQIDRRNSVTQVALAEFKADTDWGFRSFLALSKLEDPKRGYLVDDACLVEVYVSTDRTEGLISREFILETDSDKHKTKETDCVKAVTDNQTTTKTELVGIPTPSPTQPSCQIEAIEPEEPTEEDVKTFFTTLESELSSSDTVFSKEKVKEALAKVDEALNMTPANFYHSGKFSSLKQAFRILASFDCSSTTLKISRKMICWPWGECLKELADRAAVRLTEKKSMKLNITRILDGNVIRYKEVESEVKLLD
ncbi:hypothetical protein V6N11_054179 [Hibiscus sabdariffa]|uniref:MATH domain-containing protein n=1 Tax=Hibiscus sabdariffa TaxID=183260 RepID=A0ABR2S3D8_9ROSI